MTTYPFKNKWRGFSRWSQSLGPSLRVLSLVGLALFLWSRQGRFVLLIGLTSLLPYAFTWQIRGGAEWHFTMHVYPLFLLASFWAMHEIGRLVTSLARNRAGIGSSGRSRQRRGICAGDGDGTGA